MTQILLDTRVLSILNASSKGNQQIFRRAFIHSALILFVIVCGACAILVYHILEPFFSSILWSILSGALLFPLKTRCTSLTQRYLHQLDTDSHLLIFGLIILFPLKILDEILEFFGLLCIRKWKELIIIIIFLPSIEFLQSDIVYRCLITIGDNYFLLFERHIHLFDSRWIILIIFIYFSAVSTVYNRSFELKYILNIFAIPIWFCLFVYLSQIFPIYYRFIVVNFTSILAVVGYIIEPNVNSKLTFFLKRTIKI